MSSIISEIEEYLETDFEKKLFQSSVEYLKNKNDPLRANSFSYSLRELFRHVFNRLSPADDVKKCSWFKPETENGAPSRKQRYLYAVQGGLHPKFVEDELEIDVNEYWKEIRDSINTLSKYTHVGEKTFDISDTEVTKISEEALKSLLTIFHITNDTRVQLHYSLASHIDDELMNKLILTSITEIDILSQNSYIESCEIESYSLSNINHNELLFEGFGIVDVSLNYGKRDDHCEINTGFPFTFHGYSEIDKPYDVSISFEDIKINTDSWYE